MGSPDEAARGGSEERLAEALAEVADDEPGEGDEIRRSSSGDPAQRGFRVRLLRQQNLSVSFAGSVVGPEIHAKNADLAPKNRRCFAFSWHARQGATLPAEVISPAGVRVP